MEIQYYPTEDMIGDYFTNLIQGGILEKFKIIWNTTKEVFVRYKREYKEAKAISAIAKPIGSG